MLTLTLFRVFWILFHKKKTFLFLQRLGFEKDCVRNIEGHKTFHTFRYKKAGGGVSIFTKKSIHPVQNLNLSYCNDNIEACIVEIKPNVGSKENSTYDSSKNTVYKAPNSPIRPLTVYIDNLFTEFSRYKIILTDDFNIDLLNEDAESDLCGVMFSYNVFPLINIATRITENAATCLDHVWYDGMNLIHYFPLH